MGQWALVRFAWRMIQAKKSRMSLLLLGSMRMGIILSIWMVWLSRTLSLLRYSSQSRRNPETETTI